MTRHAPRRTEQLRKGRLSLPGARYFLTGCTANRAPVLTKPEIARTISTAGEILERDGDWQPLALTIMPDHWHALFTLGDRLPLARVMAKFKTLSRPAGTEWRWQANVFEHRLRADEASEDYAFYIFMNPYQAGLIGMQTAWPWWHHGVHRFQFEDALDEAGCPPTEWLVRLETVERRICQPPG